MKIILENIRSFAGLHEIPAKPLTLIVGENSSGKTTFLSMVSAMFGAESLYPSRPSFNEAPYDLGSYDTIATYKGGKYGRAKRFSLGYEDEANDERVIASYVSRLGQPVFSHLKLTRTTGSLAIDVDGDKVILDLNIAATETHPVIEIHTEREAPVGFIPLGSLGFFVYNFVSEDGHQYRNALRTIADFAEIRGRRPTLSLAPVRTKPRRTYDVISDEYQPEGEHIPILLSRFLAPGGTIRQRDALHSALEEFGEESGLFTNVRVKKLGKSPSDPFRILVAVSGPPFNLTDVGYGVSQSLPVVVQSVLAARSRLLLLQQPEVHLHPRAQAALGSLFCRLLASGNRHFIVETHSDYLVDRIRQEVARGNIRREDICVIFFYRKRALSKTFQLEIDEKGNILGAPHFYREFFVKEETNLITRGKS